MRNTSSFSNPTYGIDSIDVFDRSLQIEFKCVIIYTEKCIFVVVVV